MATLSLTVILYVIVDLNKVLYCSVLSSTRLENFAIDLLGKGLDLGRIRTDH